MSAAVAHWPGTDAELRELRSAVSHNCGCAYDVGPRLTATRLVRCGAHEMLESAEQTVLDHLVFIKRLASFFQAAERDLTCRPEGDVAA